MSDLAAHVAILAGDHRTARRDLLAGLPEAAADWRPAPGLPALGWHLVHAAWVRATVLVRGDGGMDDGIDRWHEACRIGCPVAADGAFGGTAAVLEECERLDALATARVAGWGAEMLDHPLPTVEPRLLADPGHDRRAAALTMAAHDAYHLGQAALIRRLHGVAPLE